MAGLLVILGCCAPRGALVEVASAGAAVVGGAAGCGCRVPFAMATDPISAQQDYSSKLIWLARAALRGCRLFFRPAHGVDLCSTWREPVAQAEVLPLAAVVSTPPLARSSQSRSCDVCCLGAGR